MGPPAPASADVPPNGGASLGGAFWIRNAIPSAGKFCASLEFVIWNLKTVVNPPATGCFTLNHAPPTRWVSAGVRRKMLGLPSGTNAASPTLLKLVWELKSVNPGL